MKETLPRAHDVLLPLVLCAITLFVGCAGDGDGPTGDDSLTTCPAGQLPCVGGCADPTTNGSHCGGCGLLCPAGNTCSAGACRAADGSVVPAIQVPAACPAGQMLCNGACADLTSSDTDCGACGNTCAAGDVCDQSGCRPIGAACPPGRALCDGACFDLSNSSQNCAACGTSCGAGSCLAGACTCAAGEAPCNGGCVSFSADASNCGACGSACAMGQSCNAGMCQCPAEQTVCDGACTDTTSDTAHCGACAMACATGQLCTAGTCVCPTGQSLCEAGCVDLLTSNTDCGVCGTACGGGQMCVSGSCECPTGQTLCGDTCFDLMMNDAHCGVCDNACTGGQVCGSGTCACPEGQTLCDEMCTDTAASTEHCGMCGNACFTGQLCNASVCECPEGQLLCEEACLDTQTDDLNCGGCGIECTGGQTCQQASCECPEGQSFCDDTCIDTQTDDLNCGGCGVACGLGELCNDSMCQGGGLGEDGCEGIGESITLNRLSFYQTVEIPLMESGQEVGERIVDVVAGRDTLVRVFVEVDGGFAARQMSARLFLDDGTERFTVYTEAPQTISGSSEDEERDSTFEFLVTGDMLREDMTYAVEVVECGAAPGAMAASPRFPSQDGADLNAVRAGSLQVHFVPLRANDMLPDTSEEVLEAYRQSFLATYPVDSIVFAVGEPYDIANAQDWSNNLQDLRNLRDSESPDPAVYYYGLLKPTENIRDFCQGGCTAGIGYVPNGTGQFAQSGRVSMGLAYGNDSTVRTMLHEIGHNHGRNHAPCVPPGSSISGVDPDYPYDNADVGVYGYNILTDQLIPPDVPDMMAYCDDPWISDYTYEGLLSTVRAVNQTQQSVIVPSERVGEFVVLIVEPAKPLRWGNPRPGTVVADGIALSAEVLDSMSVAVESIEVYKNEIADYDAYSVDVPAPQPGWHALHIAGVGVVAF